MTDNETTDEIDMLDVLKGRFGAGQGVITLSRDMSDAQMEGSKNPLVLRSAL
ncbi:MAG: hypothetical protein ABF443_14875 [Acetobacter malorum]|uniref:hypothetical protein n=1 Tax=Acetobacteraceae TaxID=433 RepID=UPI001889DB7D|nr:MULTISPECIES: hypothetical protein [unclassified Gluconobacter]MBF0851612.1 hypothetical protein [Gluconobacter sp. R75690]MBF0880898.1 hypothetical protein [Gluconobacter sp. R75828]